jgi:hypothetical protein
MVTPLAGLREKTAADPLLLLLLLCRHLDQNRSCPILLLLLLTEAGWRKHLKGLA